MIGESLDYGGMILHGTGHKFCRFHRGLSKGNKPRFFFRNLGSLGPVQGDPEPDVSKNHWLVVAARVADCMRLFILFF